MKQITKYICSKCGEEYRRKSFCKRHEATCFSRGCNECKHVIHLLGGNVGCLRIFTGEDCKFEAKEKSK